MRLAISQAAAVQPNWWIPLLAIPLAAFIGYGLRWFADEGPDLPPREGEADADERDDDA